MVGVQRAVRRTCKCGRKEVRALAGSPEAVAAREEAERNLRNIVETYAEHTPLALGLVVVHDECIGGRARRWLDPDGEEPYKIRCSMRVTAYYGATGTHCLRA